MRLIDSLFLASKVLSIAYPSSLLDTRGFQFAVYFVPFKSITKASRMANIWMNWKYGWFWVHLFRGF